MTIAKSQHKAILARRFYIDGRERPFPLEKLVTASNSLKKLLEGGENQDGGVRFVDGAVDFNVEEAKFLKDLLSEIKTATISELQFLDELKELLQ